MSLVGYGPAARERAGQALPRWIPPPAGRVSANSRLRESTSTSRRSLLWIRPDWDWKTAIRRHSDSIVNRQRFFADSNTTVFESKASGSKAALASFLSRDLRELRGSASQGVKASEGA